MLAIADGRPPARSCPTTRHAGPLAPPRPSEELELVAVGVPRRRRLLPPQPRGTPPRRTRTRARSDGARLAHDPKARSAEGEPPRCERGQTTSDQTRSRL